MGAAFVGAGGATLAGWLNSGRQAKAQYRLAMRAAKVTAYEEALGLCGHLRDWAERTFPTLQEGGAPDPVLADVADQIRARALIMLHGSEAVRGSYESFDGAMRRFWALVMEMRHDGDRNGLWREIEDARQVIRSELVALQDIMRADIDLLPTS
jgi:hypothetical protein